MVTAGAKIKKLREIRGYSQSFMAVKLGISQTQYSYLENKQKCIAEDVIKIIAVLLGVSVAYLENFDPDDVIQNEITLKEKMKMQDFKGKSHIAERNAYLELIARLKEEIAELKAQQKK